MAARDKVREKLRKYPHIRPIEDEDTTSIQPVSEHGFWVRLLESHGTIVVACDDWGREYESEEEAVECFLLALSERCRLEVGSRGSVDYKWTLQFLTAEGWTPEVQCITIMFLPFWRPYRERYLQNHLLPAEVETNA